MRAFLRAVVGPLLMMAATCTDAAAGLTSSWRWTASAGPALLDDDYLGSRTGLAFGAGVEFSDHPYVRLGAWVDLNAFETDFESFYVTSVMGTLRVVPVPETWRLKPYGLFGSGYATPARFTGAYPFGSQWALGLRYELPGGREIFIEHCWLHGRDVTVRPIRLGITFP